MNNIERDSESPGISATLRGDFLSYISSVVVTATGQNIGVRSRISERKRIFMVKTGTTSRCYSFYGFFG